MTRHFQYRWLLVLVALTLSTSASGCASTRNWFGGRFAAPVQYAIAEGATAQDIVVHLNENTNKLRGWRTTRAKIAMKGSLLSRADATIVVESPRNFRLVAAGPVGKEADLGSNAEQFWFWAKRNEDRKVIVASHDLDPERMRRFPFPFQPDWIMETMGVIAIDPDEKLTVEPGPTGSYLVSLIANRMSPQGYKVRKVTVVDRRAGVICEHALWDANNHLIAKAKLSQHFRDPKSKALIPAKIELDWPQAQLGLTMTLSEVEVNPTRYSQDTWKLPVFKGYDVFDLNR